MGDHKGDPCIYCRVPHDAVPVGPCHGLPATIGDWVLYTTNRGDMAIDEVMATESRRVYLRHTQQWLSMVCIEGLRR